MAVTIDMPKLSDTMEEGGIAEWLKQEGEFIAEGEPLVSIETDKATMEYSSPEEGTLLKILVPAGKSAALNQPIAILGAKGEELDVNKLLASKGGKKKPAASENNENKQKDSPPLQPEASAKETQPSAEQPLPSASAMPERVKASPLAKKRAQEKGLDLRLAQGSGPHGRIVLKDIAKLESASAGPLPATSLPSLKDEKIPLSMMRKTIAKRLLAGKNEAPHFYLNVSANMQAMLSWREQLNRSPEPQLEGEQTTKVSMNDLIILATAKALRRHPQINASWQEDYILQHGRIDIAMAVALPSGLITPLIVGADQLGLREIAAKAKELVKKAKEGRLSPAEYQGGTFTISNLGMTKVESFTAIINPPQACILAIGRIQACPVVADNGTIIAQPRMQMTLSCDHRVVDGMLGARFLESLIDFLENPLMMLA